MVYRLIEHYKFAIPIMKAGGYVMETPVVLSYLKMSPPAELGASLALQASEPAIARTEDFRVFSRELDHLLRG